MTQMYSRCLTALQQELGAAGLIAPEPPRQLITRSGTRRRTGYPSYRFGRWMQGESPLELSLARLNDLSFAVTDAKTQPVVLRIPDQDDERGFFKYTPDCAVAIQSTIDGAIEPVIVECKPYEIAQESDVVRKHDLIRKALAQIELPFVVLTEKELPESLNPTFNEMFCYARFRRSPAERKELERQVRGKRVETFGELEAKLGKPNACHALSSGWWYFNHHQPLTEVSPLSLDRRLDWDAARPMYSRSQDEKP